MRLFILSLFILTMLGASEEYNSIKKSYLSSYNYEQMGKYSEAIKVLAPLHLKYPKGYTLNLRFGWLFFLDKKYNDAQKHYKIAALSKPYAIEPRLGLIRVDLATASYTKAEQVAQELLKVDYYNYYANIYITQALIAQKKYDIAYSVVSKMLAIYPTDVSFLELLALVYEKTQSPYLEEVYEDILILDPNNVFVNNKKGL
ncbi:hypothetical protein JHD47_00690 [Sulfurimonas sp. SAG-AH-194-L11]|nr:hypothetical protein [Sulfurimonas sp. SAG-AH-194-L11]MDF1876331.1 hypothetical protein [Sulfurimonas sp. SAG-AH-194-L11]